MRIKDHGIGAAQTAQLLTEAAAEGESCSVRRVDVEPGAMLCGERSQRHKIVEASGGSRSRRADQDEFAESGFSRGRKSIRHGRNIGAELRVERDFENGVSAQAQNSGGPRDGVM